MKNSFIDINGLGSCDNNYDNMFGCYWTRKFTDRFPNVSTFIEEYHNCGIDPLISDDSANTLYYLLYSKYGNSNFAGSDEEQSVYRLFSIVFMYGPTWEKRLEIQNKLRGLKEEDLILGSKQIYNHAYNPGSAPNTSTLEELKFINEQNTSSVKRNKLDAYGTLAALLSTDVTKAFIEQFKELFISFAGAQEPLWYTESSNETEKPEPEDNLLEITTLDEYSTKGYSRVKVADADIKPENIKQGVNILGIEGTLSTECPLPDLREVTVKSDSLTQEILPEGFDGFDRVIVTGDSNLKPENIKRGISILGVNGTLGTDNLLPIPNCRCVVDKGVKCVYTNNKHIDVVGNVTGINWFIVKLSYGPAFASSLSDVVSISKDDPVFLTAGKTYSLTTDIVATSGQGNVNIIIVWEDDSRTVYTIEELANFTPEKNIKSLWYRMQGSDLLTFNGNIEIKESPVRTLDIDSTDGDLGYTNVIGPDNPDDPYNGLTEEEIAEIEAIRQANGI